jgi:osmoprotectant transport system permease protein
MSLFHFIDAFFSDGAHWHGYDGIPHRVLEHLQYTFTAFGIAAAIGLPVGLLTGHTGRGGNALAVVASAARALPTLGLLVLMFLWRGIGETTAMVPLVALAVPPVLVTTYEALRSVDPSPVDAARGMGMGPAAVLFRVELPMALPVVLGGLRSAMVQVVATTSIAAYISLGGLGRYLFDGLAQHDYAVVVGGATLIAALAVVMLGVFWVVERSLVSAGVRRR